MRALRKVLASVLGAVLVAALFALANPAPASAADSSAESQFVAKINAIRASHGLSPLAVYSEVTGVARQWTDQMVANGGISHNPNLANDVTANWTKLGENVGVGSSVDSLMTAFVNSPAHYKNIVDPDYNYIGVGVSYGSDGRMYTTHDFMALDNGSSPPPPPVQAPAPAPKQKAAAAPASTPVPADAAPALPPPVPAPPATAGRMHTVLTALRVVGT
jgi:Cysteine-rich secretory protein family